MNGHWGFRHAPGAACIVVVVAAVLSMMPAATHAEVSFEWVTVGNAGNAGEVQSQGTFGAVAYEYRIAATEVTNGQYVEFLNAVDAGGTNPNAVYSANMGSNDRGGISFDVGAAEGSKYASRTDMANKPVTYVSFLSAMRFVNWLENGQGTGGTEAGAYTISDGLSETRKASAGYFIPSEDEWYKAAYHQPAGQGGDSDNYWLYPTAGNSAPTIATATTTGDIANPGTNVANYNFGADWNSQNGNVTTVGSAGSDSESFYGTSDQAGNLWEWNEAVLSGASRGLRGGSWIHELGDLQASTRWTFSPSVVSGVIGFRVASAVPEPASVVLVVLGAPLLLRRRRP